MACVKGNLYTAKRPFFIAAIDSTAAMWKSGTVSVGNNDKNKLFTVVNLEFYTSC